MVYTQSPLALFMSWFAMAWLSCCRRKRRKLIFDSRDGYLDPAFEHKVKELQGKFEQAPGASGLLQVDSVYLIQNGARERQYKLAVENLHERVSDHDFPKPAWQDEELPAKWKHDREVVLDDLKRISEPALGAVSQATVYHGCAKKASRLISNTSFAANVQRTKGWYGEGVYTTTEPMYALRYAFGFTEFWEATPQMIGTVLVAQAAFASVYPVTRADYTKDPLKCDLKGERLKYGCDAHVASVRRTPPHGDEPRWTYQACEGDQRAEARELVIQQEVHLLPQFVVEVRVLDNSTRRSEMRKLFEQPGEQVQQACFEKLPETKDDGGRQVQPPERPPSVSALGADPTPTPSTLTRRHRVAIPGAPMPPQQATGISDVGANQVRSGTGPALPATSVHHCPGDRNQHRRDAPRFSSTAATAVQAGDDTDLPSDEAILNALRNAQRPLHVREIYLLAKALNPERDQMGSGVKKPLTNRLYKLKAAGQVMDKGEGRWEVK